MVHSRRIMYLIWFSFLAFSIFEGVFLKHADILSLIHGLILILGAILWVSNHAIENELRASKGAILFCVLFPILGVPYYLIREFGFKIGGVRTLWFVLFILICCFTYLIPIEFIQLLRRYF